MHEYLYKGIETIFVPLIYLIICDNSKFQFV